MLKKKVCWGIVLILILFLVGCSDCFGFPKRVDKYYYSESDFVLSTRVRLAVSASNINIVIKPLLDGEGYKLHLDLRVKAPSYREADIFVEEQIEFEPSVDVLSLKIKDIRMAGTITLMVPANRHYTVDLTSCNGRIEMDGLKGDSFTLESSNGSLKMKELVCTNLRGSTSNARIEASRVQAAEIDLSTNNGRIDYSGEALNTSLFTTNSRISIRPLHSEFSKGENVLLEANSSNGRIRANLLRSKNYGYNIKAKTNNGSIRYSTGRRYFDVGGNTRESEDFNLSAWRTSLNLETSNANIRIVD